MCTAGTVQAKVCTASQLCVYGQAGRAVGKGSHVLQVLLGIEDCRLRRVDILLRHRDAALLRRLGRARGDLRVLLAAALALRSGSVPCVHLPGQIIGVVLDVQQRLPQRLRTTLALSAPRVHRVRRGNQP